MKFVFSVFNKLPVLSFFFFFFFNLIQKTFIPFADVIACSGNHVLLKICKYV